MKIKLTTSDPASSYGLPVLVIDGQTYGPADMTPSGPAADVVITHGAELAPSMVRRFLSQLPGLQTRHRCLRCGHKWTPRGMERPRVCPGCHSPYWDKPKK